MKITGFSFEQLTAHIDVPFELFAERLIRPLDVYPEHRAQGAAAPERLGDGRYEVRNIFMTVHTDDGLDGVVGPVNWLDAAIVYDQIAPLLLGEDPLATEKNADLMYRHLIHGRKGSPMIAVSVVDCALWDLRGKAMAQPVYRLLGGPTRTTIPAYASMLGFSIEPDQAAAAARDAVAQGFGALKWFVRDGAADGAAGMDRIEGLVAAVRAAVGPQVDLMVDAWSSWDERFALAMAHRLEPYRLRWLEEVVKADHIPGYARVRAVSPVPIAGGEHEYTRWGVRDLLRAEAVDVLQVDTFWAGGVSEMMKIAALASAFEVQLIPHGHSVPANAHVSAALSPGLTPLIEYLIQWNAVNQACLAEPVVPQQGLVRVSDTAGLGLAVDYDKVSERRAVEFG